MTPQEIVERLAEILAPHEELTEVDPLAELGALGVSAEEAKLAYDFTQIAWTRAALEEVGVEFLPTWMRFDRNGDLIDSGLLADQPYFVAASAIGERWADSNGFAWMLATSADYDAFHSATSQGAEPADLKMGPAALFSEPPTKKGVVRARKRLVAEVRSDGAGGS